MIEGGKITSWTSLAAAALAPNTGYFRNAQGALESFSFEGLNATIGLSAQTISYVTPWVGLAETYIRNDGNLTPADWASAIGSTLATAVTPTSQGNTFTEQLQGAALRTGVHLLVAGALKRYDKDAAYSYFYNSVGNEAGQLIGQNLVTALQEALARPAAQAIVDANNNPIAAAPTTDDTDEDRTPALPAVAQRDGASPQEATILAQEPWTQVTVRRGQTLGAIIADRYGVGYDEALILKIAALNGLSDPHKIFAGQELILPALGSGLLESTPISRELLASYQAGLRPAETATTPPEQAINTALSEDPAPTQPEVAAPAPQDEGISVQQSLRVASALDDFKASLKKGGLTAVKGLSKVITALEINELKQLKAGIQTYLDEQGARVVREGGAFSELKLMGLGIVYASVEALFPETILDVTPAKLISGAGKVAKNVLKVADEAPVKQLDNLATGQRSAANKLDNVGVEPGNKTSLITENAKSGKARELAVQRELEAKYPNASVQREQYLRDASGNIVRDELTGTARRVDHVVIQNGRAVDVVETTSLTAPKVDQIAKENRIRVIGGTYIRDRQTGKLISIESIPTRIERR